VSRLPAPTVPRAVLGVLLILPAVLATGAVVRPLSVPAGEHGLDPAVGPLSAALQRELAGVRAAVQSRVLEAEDDRLLDLVAAVPFGAPPYTAGEDGDTTLVLTPTGRDYGLADLQALGAAVPGPPGTVDLVRHVLVAPGASLRIEAPGTTLRLRSEGDGFVSLVAWKAALTLAGAPGAPLTVTSWDPTAGAPDPSPVDGRAYLRTSGGTMALSWVQAADLGFWSGRTGGVSWTGSPRAASSGTIAHCTFVRGHYGVFASGSRDLQVTDSAFEGNEVDGLALHRRAVGTVVTGGRAIGNGRHGISADLGSEGLRVTGVELSRNAVTGLSFSGRAFAVGPSAGGGSPRTYGGLTVTGGRAEGNGRAGVRVDQAFGVSISDLAVAGSRDGVVLVGTRAPTTVQGSEVRDARRFGVSVQGGAAQLVGNRLVGGRTGIRLVDASGAVRHNRVRAAAHYGVSVSGSSVTAVEANILAGRGSAAVDTYRLGDGADVAVQRNDETGWTVDEDDWVYWSRFVPRHPMVVLWVVVLLLPALSALRRRHGRPVPGTPPYADELRRTPSFVPLPPLDRTGALAAPVREGRG
jgi:Periplasmic copper-binding protein (NosD)